ILSTKQELMDHLTHLMGGRSAEELRFNEVTSGAQNDLERATKLARQMVMEWGMSEELGPLTFGRPTGELVFLGRDIARDRNYSEDVAEAIDREVRSIVEKAHQRAKETLKAHWDELERVVRA